MEPLQLSINELAASRDRAVAWELPPDILVFGGANREKMIRAVLFKLLDNAIKYATPETPVALQCAQDVATVQVHIVSHGKLVPETERKAIWYLDFRGSNVASGTGGTGQGLYQARVIAERLDGQATYASREPDVNIFTLTLPRAPETR